MHRVRQVHALITEAELGKALNVMAPLLTAVQDPAMSHLVTTIHTTLKTYLQSQAQGVNTFFSTLLLSLVESLVLHAGVSPVLLTELLRYHQPGDPTLHWGNVDNIVTCVPLKCTAKKCKVLCRGAQTIKWFQTLDNGRMPGLHSTVAVVDTRWFSILAVSDAIRTRLRIGMPVIVAGGNTQRALPHDTTFLEAVTGTWSSTTSSTGAKVHSLRPTFFTSHPEDSDACSVIARSSAETETGTLTTALVEGYLGMCNDRARAIAQCAQWPEPACQVVFSHVAAEEMRQIAFTRFSAAGTFQRLHLERGGMAVSLTNSDISVRLIVLGTPREFTDLNGPQLKDVYEEVYEILDENFPSFNDLHEQLQMSIFILRPGESV
jgi:hypothetical protein